MIKLNNTLCLAPMAELTHNAHRYLIEGFGGCDLYFTEMISAAAYLGGADYESYYADYLPCPEKTIFQLVGESAVEITGAAMLMKDFPVAGFDINMGCSAWTIVNKGWGISWMKDIEKSADCVKKLKDIFPDKSISVKFRIGYEDDSAYMIKFAQALELAGADFLTLNPQVKKECRSRPGDWSYVKMLKDNLSIPIIGNGNIRGQESLEYRKKVSGADGYMIGRFAIEKPWIFALLKGKENNSDFSIDVNLEETGKKFFELLEKYQHPDFFNSRASRFMFYYTSNLIFGSHLINQIRHAQTYDDIKNHFFEYFQRNPEERIKTFS